MSLIFSFFFYFNVLHKYLRKDYRFSCIAWISYIALFTTWSIAWFIHFKLLILFLKEHLYKKSHIGAAIIFNFELTWIQFMKKYCTFSIIAIKVLKVWRMWKTAYVWPNSFFNQMTMKNSSTYIVNMIIDW